MDRTTIERLHDALDACTSIELSIIGLGERIFLDAVEPALCTKWLMIVLGGTLSRALQLHPGLEKQIPDAQVAIDLRDRLLDELSAIDDALVWRVTTTSVPKIRQQIERALEGRRS